MPKSTRSTLNAIANREFARIGGQSPTIPTESRFRGRRVKLAKFGPHWDARRGTAIRLTSVLLTEDDQELQRRVCEDQSAARTYSSAAALLSQEAAHLRRVTEMHETAAARLTAVLARCQPVQS